MFEISTAKREVLEKLAERDWTPTDLARELGKSRTSVYNHLDDLHRQGLLSKRSVPAKTRPKTEYSIGDGIVQYVSVLPGQYRERRLRLTPSKEAIIRIWNLPQESFHPHVEQFWWRLTNSEKIDYRDDIAAVAVYGSVARGDADQESDIDFLVIAADADTARLITETYGSVRIKAGEAGAKIGMTETYSLEDYRESLAHDSDFLTGILDDLHAIYDPDGVL